MSKFSFLMLKDTSLKRLFLLELMTQKSLYSMPINRNYRKISDRPFKNQKLVFLENAFNYLMSANNIHQVERAYQSRLVIQVLEIIPSGYVKETLTITRSRVFPSVTPIYTLGCLDGK